jgi:hypothetical protein
LFPEAISTREATRNIKEAMRQKVDSKWSWNWCRDYIEEDVLRETVPGDWQEITFAEPLKKAVSVLFNINYRILPGHLREERETPQTKAYQFVGILSARDALRLFGTEIC